MFLAVIDVNAVQSCQPLFKIYKFFVIVYLQLVDFIFEQPDFSA